VTCGRAPTPAHVCVACGGEFSIALLGNGDVDLGYVELLPAASWGRVPGTRGLVSAANVLKQVGTQSHGSKEHAWNVAVLRRCVLCALLCRWA
jgi:hypothetical protein